MNRRYLKTLVAVVPSLLLAGWIMAQETQRRGFSIAITEPANQELIVGKTKIAAKVKIDDPDLIDRVEFVVGDEVIFVDRENPSTAPVRRAMAHLRGGGVLGLFPEGHIERPPRTLLPFHAGVGAFVRPTGAPVLPVVIRGTPKGVRSAWMSLFVPSRARLRIYEPIRYERSMSPAEIAEDLKRRYMGWTGWPASSGASA